MKVDKNQLLRFTTAGSVDDGKSTLIGRLLYDSKSIFEDQLSAVAKVSKKKGLENIDLALFTDGLRDEREQGITIDVAYRYFTTPKRHLMTPTEFFSGHFIDFCIRVIFQLTLLRTLGSTVDNVVPALG